MGAVKIGEHKRKTPNDMSKKKIGRPLNDLTSTSSTRYHGRLSKVRIHIEDGRFHILGLGAWHAYWRDPYYLMLTVPWQGFFAITVGSYVLANAIAAFLFYLGGPETILNSDGSFLNAFFFSVQTSASIGYGAMTPGTVYGNALVALEAIVSILGISVLTGLSYARFARPTAQVLFSRVAVVAPFNGTPTLMFRAANERRNQIVEAKMRVHLTLDEHSDGRMMRRFYEMNLLRDRNPSFFLTWTALHPIDENSPLYGLTHKDLVRTSAALLVSLSGIDQTVNQAIHTRHNYYAGDLRWNQNFKDILYELEDGDRYIDFADFHEVE